MYYIYTHVYTYMCIYINWFRLLIADVTQHTERNPTCFIPEGCISTFQRALLILRQRFSALCAQKCALLVLRQRFSALLRFISIAPAFQQIQQLYSANVSARFISIAVITSVTSITIPNTVIARIIVNNTSIVVLLT